jgi:signal transduction histidine kinase
LHDETAQSLTALAISIETALQKPTNSAAEVKRLLVPARSLTERVSRELDRIIRDLRPSLLDDLGLMEALAWYADNRLRPLGVQVTFETVGTERRLPPALETALFRVIQEGISNIARHSKAENVSLTVEFGDGYVALDLEDDGCGFDVDSTLGKGKDGDDDSPFGLLGMRERTELMGGTLCVESRPGQGTSVRVRVPLDAERVYA